MTTSSGPEPSPRDVAVRAQLLTTDDVRRALRRMAHEIIERNADGPEIVVLGIQRGGTALARELSGLVRQFGGLQVHDGTLDVAFFRDDLAEHPVRAVSGTDIPVDLTDRTVVLVDDVLYTGRTIRAALNALAEWGRPRAIQLAVLVDRGHRELPIRADFVGKNVPTRQGEAILASLTGVWIGDEAGE